MKRVSPRIVPDAARLLARIIIRLEVIILFDGYKLNIKWIDFVFFFFCRKEVHMKDHSTQKQIFESLRI